MCRRQLVKMEDKMKHYNGCKNCQMWERVRKMLMDDELHNKKKMNIDDNLIYITKKQMRCFNEKK